MNQQIITKELLSTLGVTLDDEAMTSLVDRANSTLHERVGAEITSSLDDSQLEEMVALQEDENDAKLAKWLKANVPDLANIIEDERDILLEEIARGATLE